MMAGFDPDAYLASAPAPFDPDAYLARPSLGTDIANEGAKGAARGALAGGDLLMNAVPGVAMARNAFNAANSLTGANAQVPTFGDIGRSMLPDVSPSPNASAPARYAGSITEAVANPASYAGPGSLALKAGGSILSGLLGQVGEDTGIPGGRLAGSLAGGLVANKALGPTKAVAAAPTYAELKAASDTGYDAVRNSGVEFDPRSLAQWAAQQQQKLTTGPKYAFTGGQYGTAPKTLDLLDTLQNPPAGSTSTAANLDTIRRAIGNIAGETNAGRPTPDAKAAMVLKREFAQFFENPPKNTVVAGNAADFATPLKEANANAAAGYRVKDIEQRINNAQVNTEGSIAANLANQVKSQLRPILKNPKMQRGFTSDEVGAINDVNKGTALSNFLNQIGRGGAGVVPLGLHFAAGIPAALATGGATVLPQIALAAGLYGARKAGERMTLNQAQALAEQLAKRSPLYQNRVNALGTTSTLPNQAQILRNGLLGLTQ